MKEKIKNIIIVMLVAGFTSITVSAATLMKSKDVIFDNKNTGMSATDVQSAVDELYSAATDYSTLNNKVNSLKTEIIDTIYPKGSIYISVEDDTVEKVQAKFGGTWERYSEGRTLVAAGTTTDSNGNVTTYAVGNTGGNTSVTLTTDNLPSHNHSFTPSGTNSYTTSAVTTGNNSASHTHSIPSLSVSTWSASHFHKTIFGVAKFNIPNDGTINGFMSIYDYNGTNTYFTESTGMTTGSTTITVSGQTTTASTTGNQSANHTHSITAANLQAAIGTITFTGTAGTTGNTGSASQVNIQNPYTVVYMYKRVN